MGFKDRLRRLQRVYVEEMTVSIPQEDGSVARFYQSDLIDAYHSALDRELGRDVPDHPLSQAARRSPERAWSEGVYAGVAKVPDEEVEDLSEP